MGLSQDDAVTPIAPVPGDRAGLSNFPSAPFSSAGTTPGQRSPDASGEGKGERTPPADPRSKQEATDAAIANMIASSTRLCFERHEITGKMVARLKDGTTGEVLRQVPPEEMLKIAEAIDKYLGLLVDRHS